MSSKKPDLNAEDSESEYLEPGMFFVEKILDSKIDQKNNKKKLYLVKWKGYTDLGKHLINPNSQQEVCSNRRGFLDNTWEPIESFDLSPHILEEYEGHLKSGKAKLIPSSGR